MDPNMWNNQKINIGWKICFIRQQQRKISTAQYHTDSSHYHQIFSGFGSWEFLISQVSILLYMMKQNWKII